MTGGNMYYSSPFSTPDTPESYTTPEVSESQTTPEQHENIQETIDNKLEEGAQRLGKVEGSIKNSIDFLLNNLGQELTVALVHRYNFLRALPNFKGLPNSMVWLEALNQVYLDNKDKLQGEKELYINNFIFLLNDLKSKNIKIENLGGLLTGQALISQSLAKLENDINNLDTEKQKYFFGMIRTDNIV